MLDRVLGYVKDVVEVRPVLPSTHSFHPSFPSTLSPPFPPAFDPSSNPSQITSEQGKKTGDKAVGRYLMDTFGMGTEEMERGGFTGSLQDTLMMSYLANLVRAQAEVSSRLALVTAA